MARQVFISYASEDKAIADRVCQALESAGASCWIAPSDIEAGTDYPAAIVEAVESTRVMVLILTETAMASPHVLSEVGHAHFSTVRRQTVKWTKMMVSTRGPGSFFTHLFLLEGNRMRSRRSQTRMAAFRSPARKHLART